MGLLDILTGGGSSGSGKAEGLQAQALAELDKIQFPSIESQKFAVEQLVQQGIITPEQGETYLAPKSEFEDIALDPQAQDAQLRALSGLTDISTTGDPPLPVTSGRFSGCVSASSRILYISDILFMSFIDDFFPFMYI